jgi:hypothetical protein
MCAKLKKGKAHIMDIEDLKALVPSIRMITPELIVDNSQNCAKKCFLYVTGFA